MDNNSMIKKSFDTQDFQFDGELNRVQQEQYVVLVKKFSTLLDKVRFVRMRTRRESVDKLHISEPITAGIGECQDSADRAQAKFSAVDLDAVKLRTAWDITSEFARNNIERDRIEDTLMENLTHRMATDFEFLMIQGDTALPAGSPQNNLLRTLDGLDKLTESSHIVDVGGDPLTFNVFSQLWRALPSQFRSDTGLKWIISDVIANDWTNELSLRATTGGDAAIGGQPLRPLGRAMLVVPLLPSDKQLTVDSGTPAEVQGDRFGPFTITAGVNDQLDININAAGIRNVVFTPGVKDTVKLANEINAVFIANNDPAVALDNGQGELLIRTTAVGAGESIDVQGSSTVLADLGLVAGVFNGATNGTPGIIREGSFVWLTNPKNFIFGLVDGTRIYSRFNPDFDKQETRIYNEVAIQVENCDSVAKAINIRRRDLS